jgi:hypothetical protein
MGPPTGGTVPGLNAYTAIIWGIMSKNLSDLSESSRNGPPAPCSHPGRAVYYVRAGKWACSDCGAWYHDGLWHTLAEAGNANGDPKPRVYVLGGGKWPKHS